MASRTYTIPADSPRTRADKALAAAFPEHSRVALQRAFSRGPGAPGRGSIRKSDDVAAGDTIEFSTPGRSGRRLRPVE